MQVKNPVIKKRSNKLKYAGIVVGVLVILGGVATALELTGVTDFYQKPTPQIEGRTAGQNTKGEPSGTADTNQPTTDIKGDTGNTQDDNKGTTGGDTAVLLEPTGNFVSAHKVPKNAPIASVCNSTAGATCKITFTMGATVKSLPAQTTDAGGSTYWNSWTPQSLGLQAGSWNIEAVATLGSQTKSVSDALKLEVSE